MAEEGEPLPPLREVTWRRLSDSPPLYWCRDFLTPEECAALINLVQSTAPSSLASSGQAKLRVDLDPEDPHHSAEAAVLRSIERRVTALSGVPPHGGEMPWAVHFTPAPAPGEEGPQDDASQPSPSPTRAAPSASPAGRRSAAGGASPQPRRGARSSSRSIGAARRSAGAAATPGAGARGAAAVAIAAEAREEGGDRGPGRMTLGLHVDTNNCRERRWVTFIVYLHSTPPSCGGHTVFPLALRRGCPEPRGQEPRRLRNAAAMMLASNVHHTGQAANPYQAAEVRDAAALLLAYADRVARTASSSEPAPDGLAEAWWDPSGMGLAVSPQQGSCVAFFTRTEQSRGAIDPRSWHGGAAVVGGAAAGQGAASAEAGGKWTLQKFREAPAETLKSCCIEAFALQHASLLPCSGGGVSFGFEEASVT